MMATDRNHLDMLMMMIITIQYLCTPFSRANLVSNSCVRAASETLVDGGACADVLVLAPAAMRQRFASSIRG